ncbi:unnamed protein product [Rhodiola kirilowii]
MPPSRSSDAPQRPARVTQLKTSSADSGRPFHRPITDNSPKLGDRQSPRGSQSAPVTQKKLGTRIAGLESQLGQAQKELKILKKQLASADPTKHGAQDKPEKITKKKSNVSEPKSVKENDCQQSELVQPSITKTTSMLENVHDDSSQELDVFEVPMEKKAPSESSEIPTPPDDHDHDEEVETKSMDTPTNLAINLEVENSLLEDLANKDEEISLLKSKLEDKEKELQAYAETNKELQKKLSDATSEVSSARVKEEDLVSKVSQLSQELEERKDETSKLCKNLEATEGIKESLEAEMKKLRVQTEQWRKAADAASAVLAGENGRSMSFNGLFEAPIGLYDEDGSPGFADEVNTGGKKKGTGIRMLGDLWKKKGRK